jgi:hypothetical protein
MEIIRLNPLRLRNEEYAQCMTDVDGLIQQTEADTVRNNV